MTPLSSPLDQTIVVNYGVDNWVSFSTITFQILICNHTKTVEGPLTFSFDTFGEGQPMFLDKTYRLSSIFEPTSPRCIIGDGIPRLAMTEHGAFVTDTIVQIEDDFLKIDIS